jgi:hypothetical protein
MKCAGPGHCGAENIGLKTQRERVLRKRRKPYEPNKKERSAFQFTQFDNNWFCIFLNTYIKFNKLTK